MDLDLVNKTYCYVIVSGQKDKQGYIPSIVIEGESGHYPLEGGREGSTAITWGHDLTAAEHTCEDMNTRLGITPQVARRLVMESMK